MQLIGQLKRAPEIGPVELALKARVVSEIVKSVDDILEGRAPNLAHGLIELQPISLKLSNNALHLRTPARVRLLRHGFTGREALQVLVEELAREHVLWNAGIFLIRQAEQGLAERHLIGGLVEAVEDQRLPVVLISELRHRDCQHLLLHIRLSATEYPI